MNKINEKCSMATVPNTITSRDFTQNEEKNSFQPFFGHQFDEKFFTLSFEH